jgi:Putative prokaryotic signal transducing protein
MNFTQFGSFDNYINASILLSRLQQEGIQCYLKDEFTNTILFNAVGGIKLMVADMDLERAKSLISGSDAELN